jgi:hypothetical protein
MVPHTSVLFYVMSCMHPSIDSCHSMIIVFSLSATIRPLWPPSFSTDPSLVVLSGVSVAIFWND